MNRIHTYIHEYEFPYHDYLLNNYGYISNIFHSRRKKANQQGMANVDLPDGPLYQFLNSQLVNIVTQNYHVSPEFMKHNIGIYLQTNQDFVSQSHNHASFANIVGVFYINPPKPGEGGEIEFYQRVYDQKPIKIQPEPNKVYFFPSWLYHRPLPQSTPTPRISLNWGYSSHIVPTHKISGDRW